MCTTPGADTLRLLKLYYGTTLLVVVNNKFIVKKVSLDVHELKTNEVWTSGLLYVLLKKIILLFLLSFSFIPFPE